MNDTTTTDIVVSGPEQQIIEYLLDLDYNEDEIWDTQIDDGTPQFDPEED